MKAYAPEVFDKAGTLAGTSGVLGCASTIAGSLWCARQNSGVTTYGSSRCASLREIADAGAPRTVRIVFGSLNADLHVVLQEMAVLSNMTLE